MLPLESIGYAALLVAALIGLVCWGTSDARDGPFVSAYPESSGLDDEAPIPPTSDSDDIPEDAGLAAAYWKVLLSDEEEAAPLARLSPDAPEDVALAEIHPLKMAPDDEEHVSSPAPPLTTPGSQGPLRFFYRDQVGKVTLARVSDWSEVGEVIVGHCEEANAARTFDKKLIVRWIDRTDVYLERPYG